MSDILENALLFLIAIVVVVPIIQRAGLGSALGYIAAGIVIGPLLGFISSEDTESIQHFAEFGIIMMLFLIGLEIRPATLWAMRAQLIGLGGLQLVITTALIFGVTVIFVEVNTALALGMMLTLSSTAIVLQTLGEKEKLASEGGRAMTSILLTQDVAVIPILAIIPLLAVAMPGALTDGAATAHANTPLAGLPGWQVALATLGAIGAIILCGYIIVPPLFRIIAKSKIAELFTATALLLIIGISAIMTFVGISPALGAFLGGMILANSEYRHQLEADIAPFKGLLLGLFFVTVGAQINVSVLTENLVLIIGLTVGLIAVKFAVLYFVGGVFKLRGSDRWLFALGLAQASEFCFVLASFAQQSLVITSPQASIISLVVVMSMLLTPLLFVLHGILEPRLKVKTEGEEHEIKTKGSVIIAGCGRFGQTVNRILLANGHNTVVIDLRPEQVETLAKFGVTGYYGDASRPALLDSAGVREVKLLVVCINSHEKAKAIIHYARSQNPKLKIIARATDILRGYELLNAGADRFVGELYGSSTNVGRMSLEFMGVHPFTAERRVQTFTKFNEETSELLSKVWDPELEVSENSDFVEIAKQRENILEREMQGQGHGLRDEIDRGWSKPEE